MHATQQPGRLGRLVDMLALAGDLGGPRLAPITSADIAQLADAERTDDPTLIEAEYLRVSLELRRRWRAGDRREWHPIFVADRRLAKIRERLEAALRWSTGRVG